MLLWCCWRASQGTTLMWRAPSWSLRHTLPSSSVRAMACAAVTEEQAHHDSTADLT